MMLHAGTLRLAIGAGIAAAGIAAALIGGAPAIAASTGNAGGGQDISGVVLSAPGAGSQTSASKLALVNSLTDSITSAAKTDAVTPLAVTYNNLTVVGQVQQQSEWCVPASGRMTLSAFGVTVTQTTLAGLMKTGSGGTDLANAPAALNKYEKTNIYHFDTSTTSAANLFARVKTDVTQFGAPIIPAIQGSHLPLWKANGYTGNHAITLYGYGSDNSSISYDDPIDVPAMYGKHATSSANIWAGMKAIQNSMTW
jgi:hypothetical protein